MMLALSYIYLQNLNCLSFCNICTLIILYLSFYQIPTQLLIFVVDSSDKLMEAGQINQEEMTLRSSSLSFAGKYRKSPPVRFCS